MDPQKLTIEEKQLLLQAKVNALASQVKRGRIATALGSIMLSVFFITTEGVGWSYTLIWLLCMTAAFVLRNFIVRKSLNEIKDLKKTENTIALSSAMLGLVIASPAVLFMPKMEPILTGLYIGILVGWVAIAVVIIGIHFRSYLLFVTICISYLIVGIWISVPATYALATTLGGLAASYMLISFSKQLSILFEESVLTGHERDDLVKRLRLSVSESLKAQNERSRFLASMAHDLVQPVHSLLLFLDILETSKSLEESKLSIGGMKSNAQSIENMFTGLLDLFRLDQGAILPSLTNVNLYKIIKKIEPAYRIKCEEKGISFLVSCADDLLVKAEPNLLERIIRNLVDNAVKYTSDGRIEILVKPTNEEIFISVIDTGIGINEEHLDSIFDAFYRASSDENQNVAGIGLGLSVAKQMTELMGGKMELESKVNVGTKVTFSLEATIKKQQDKAQDEEKLYVLPKRVLVIEDDDSARNALQLWLRNNGVATVSTNSMESALEEMKCKSFKPQHALIDYHLGPGINGIEVIRKLRIAYPGLQATIITGTFLDKDRVENDVIVLEKPLSPVKLLEVLSQEQGQ